jgi:TonB-like protein
MGTRSLIRSNRVRISTVGVLGALAVHALIFLPFVLDLSLPSSRLPNQSGAGASALVTSQEPVMTAVFINEPSQDERLAPPPEDLASRGAAPRDLPVVVFSPDATPAVQVDNASEESEDTSAPPEAVGEQTQHALLFGRYLVQVEARIERAWMRPRSEIGAPRFSCRVRIEQDRQGDVIGIKLDPCNGTERWQQSLVSAIRTASPLPAPPDASVYADRLSLSFESEGLQPGGSTQGFEPETRVANRGSQALTSFEHFANRPDPNLKSSVREDSKVIHLTIIGTPTASSPAVTPPADPPPETAPALSSPQ